jgi:hypothetical protein
MARGSRRAWDAGSAPRLALQEPPELLLALLWGASVVAMILVTRGDAWPLGVAWAAAGAVLALAWRALGGHPAIRTWLCVALAAVLVLLTWEGGLYLLPAVLAALVLSARLRS